MSSLLPSWDLARLYYFPSPTVSFEVATLKNVLYVLYVPHLTTPDLLVTARLSSGGFAETRALQEIMYTLRAVTIYGGRKDASYTSAVGQTSVDTDERTGGLDHPWSLLGLEAGVYKQPARHARVHEYV